MDCFTGKERLWWLAMLRRRHVVRKQVLRYCLKIGWNLVAESGRMVKYMHHHIEQSGRQTAKKWKKKCYLVQDTKDEKLENFESLASASQDLGDLERLVQICHWVTLLCIGVGCRPQKLISIHLMNKTMVCERFDLVRFAVQHSTMLRE